MSATTVTSDCGVRTDVELSVVVPNEPGQLARLTGTLSAAGVNIAGLMTVHAGATARVKLLAGEGRDEARRGLERSGYAVSQTTVFVLEGPSDSELAQRAIAGLAAAGVNIVSCYTHEASGVQRFVVAVDRPDLAREAMLSLR